LPFQAAASRWAIQAATAPLLTGFWPLDSSSRTVDRLFPTLDLGLWTLDCSF
jgi:hypothetical protein